VDEKYLVSFEMLCWGRMEIRWTDHVENEEVLHRIREERNILPTAKGRKANWMSHILHRKCFLKNVIEGKVEGWTEVTRRWGRRCKEV
jgi:hypothetical protein